MKFNIFLSALFFLQSLEVKSNQSTDKQASLTTTTCTKIPEIRTIATTEPATIASLTIAGECESRIWLFVTEAISPSENPQNSQPEIQLRFTVEKNSSAFKELGWLENRLLRIKSATSPVANFLLEKKMWVVFYAKIDKNNELVPTIAFIKPQIQNKNIDIQFAKLEPQKKFFSPVLLPHDGKVTVVWGESQNGESKISKATIEPGAEAEISKISFPAQDILDRLVAGRKKDETIIAWLGEDMSLAGSESDCVSIYTITLNDEYSETKSEKSEGESSGADVGRDASRKGCEVIPEKISEPICSEASLTGIRFVNEETFIDGMQGSGGKWKPFTLKVEKPPAKSKIKKEKSGVAYSNPFVSYTNVMLQLDGKGPSQAILSLGDISLPVSDNQSYPPLALYLCEKEIIGAWVTKQNQSTPYINYFDISLTDSDTDGILDEMDACEGQETNNPYNPLNQKH